MAYMNQERKAKLAPAIKAICKKYGVKATLSVDNYSTLNLNITSGSIDFIKSAERAGSNRGYDHLQVNTFWYRDHFDGIAREFLSEVIPAMNVGNHDRSDLMTDYFDVGWYVGVNIGRWNKPYVCEQPKENKLLAAAKALGNIEFVTIGGAA